MKNKKHARRVKRLALICTMCTIILVVSTYAWFIGMRTVAVNPFEVEIAATKGLYLSLNGNDWYETININSANYNDTSVVYTGNTNTWSGGGLIPMSSVGQIDPGTEGAVSRLMLYEKGSLTATKGGYRLMASRVDNHTTLTGEEGKGFVAFDLFIKNLSGSEYYGTMNPLNEEAIYLTQSSAVSVVDSGVNQDKTGIENSVRVAFAQIGRVNAEVTTPSVITGISCKDTGYNATSNRTGVTSICKRYAQIWEPNDTKHVTNAVNWYETSCRQRETGTGFTYKESTPCTGVASGTAVKSYVVGNVVDYSNYVDVYDGLNGYTGSISTQVLKGTTTTDDFVASTTDAGKLFEYDYFTDTEKMKTGMERPEFMTLAPNSITKVRVYIYLEGQDVDNYDFASLGKQIQVNFGFTKERFYAEDFGYNGPATSENGVAPSRPETLEVVTPETVDSSR